MPCPHNEISIVQRSHRQSAVAAAAYQSGEKLFCEYDQEVNAALAGAEFTWHYYYGLYTKDNLPEKATRTWVTKTVAEKDSSHSGIISSRNHRSSYLE